MRRSLLPLALLGTAGCEELSGVLDLKPPEVVLERVDLVDAPRSADLLGYGCAQTLGDGPCAIVGLSAPPKEDLTFAFDLVFSLTNPNPLPIPLVETLLGFSAFDQDNLGTVCVSFCDPKDPSCVPAVDKKGACQLEGATEVGSPEDLIPTVDELVTLASDVATETFDNGDWRVLEPMGSTETHIRFDLGIDPLIQIADDLLAQAVNDVFSGRSPAFEIPYTVEGTLFFDVPVAGRYAVGFGPFSDDWRLR